MSQWQSPCYSLWFALLTLWLNLRTFQVQIGDSINTGYSRECQTMDLNTVQKILNKTQSTMAIIERPTKPNLIVALKVPSFVKIVKRVAFRPQVEIICLKPQPSSVLTYTNTTSLSMIINDKHRGYASVFLS